MSRRLQRHWSNGDPSSACACAFTQMPRIAAAKECDVTQVEILEAVGVKASGCTQARVVELYERIDSFLRNGTPLNTVRRHLKHAGLSRDEVEAVCDAVARSRRGDK